MRVRLVGRAWYEFDITWLSLKLLRAFGLVWNITIARIGRVPEETAA